MRTKRTGIRPFLTMAASTALMVLACSPAPEAKPDRIYTYDLPASTGWIDATATLDPATRRCTKATRP